MLADIEQDSPIEPRLECVEFSFNVPKRAGGPINIRDRKWARWGCREMGIDVMWRQSYIDRRNRAELQNFQPEFAIPPKKPLIINCLGGG